MPDRNHIKTLLLAGDTGFWRELRILTEAAASFDEIFFLSTLRRKAKAKGMARPDVTAKALRLAIIGGSSLYPLHELLDHFLECSGVSCELFLGGYDNYVSEISDQGSALYAFHPQVVFLLPGAQRCKYSGSLTDSRTAVEIEAASVVDHLVGLCRTLNDRTGAEVVLANFALPARRDPGAYRSRTLASDWSFRKWVNLELGLTVPSFVRLCDLEFLVHRFGGLAAEDARGWFESKQPCSPQLLTELSREAARLIASLRRPPKKVLVLDLDNTLWGGSIGDDGLEGIELGDTSPRGEAFKAFQKHILSLKRRGVLLAVCSKNDLGRAREPFEKHPEMVLRLDDFVAFTANWNPKADNLRSMASALNLALDSFVFVDDNPAEIEIVRQFAPEVSTLLLAPDPSDYVDQLQDCGWFEMERLTTEDAKRTELYRAEAERQALQASVVNMDQYLESLDMEATLGDFSPVDVPRLAQLINKSNQFNLTTRRRTEGEVSALMSQRDFSCFSVRLKDRFGDHGLISILIARFAGETLEIDTWIMSCRVLKRQVEEFALNEVVRRARAGGCARLKGVYLRTEKNEMVRDFYPRMGFRCESATAERGDYVLDIASYGKIPTKIRAAAVPA